jgi:hypothetical protein
MRPVDPPCHVYQKVWQLASKSGPAAIGREIIFMTPQGGRRRRRQPARHGLARKFGAEMLVAVLAQSMLK